MLALTAVTGTAKAPAQTKSKGTIAFLLSGPDLYYKDGLTGAQAAAKQLGHDVRRYSHPTISPTVGRQSGRHGNRTRTASARVWGLSQLGSAPTAGSWTR